MPSTTKCSSGGISPAQVVQVGDLGMDDEQDLRCLCTEWGPGHDKASRDAETSGQKKKKSRRYQRFMARRAVEQRGLQGKTLPTTSGSSEVGGALSSLCCEVSPCGQLFEKDGAGAPREPCRLCPVAPGASQSLKNQIASPGGKGTGSSFCPTPRKCVALDCEMVGTGPAGRTSELARCTVVNYDGDVIYDKYVRPELPIVDYRTRWSGVTRRHMEKATPFKVAQSEILQIVRDKIVVGHAIHNDFRALKYFHPYAWTRDTSRSPLLRKKMGLPMKASVSLKSLASELLHKNIQVSRNGHSSVEDAQTSMELYRLVEVQWEKTLASSFLPSLPNSPPDSSSESVCYMDDQYWPKDFDAGCT
ncbi:apoptosis-enhancing nuclease [Zootoca vivipara]|uniref:apoptosis-enhancing nuclease n=1 Tax=Zootoca vivipara TaxID=8524 RepID=UPI0015906D67|nr:apoptosis-enhancing nuclease [Zootoca vivipara]